MRFNTALRLLYGFAALAALITLLTGCDNGSLNEDETTFHIRSLNLVEDSPTLQFNLDDTTISSAGYGSSTSFSAGHPGQHALSFEAILPADLDDDDDDDETTTPTSGTSTYNLLAGTDYTLVAYGTLADIRTYAIDSTDQRDDVDDEKVILQFTHAAPNVGDVDVYVTAAQAGVPSRTFLSTLTLAQTSSPREFTLIRDDDGLDDDAALSATFVIELTRAGSDEVIFRSNSISIGEQSRIMFAVADAVGPGPGIAKLVSLSGGTYLGSTDGAALKFVHTSHDTPALDVTVGSGLADPLAQNVGFRQSSDYVSIKSGENGMITVPAGAQSPYVFFEEFTAAAGGYYAAYAMGPASVVDAVVLGAEARSIPTQASFRFIQAAASLEEEPLDLYLRLPGEGVDFDDDDTAASVVAQTYQTASSYYTLKAGDYLIYYYKSGTSTLVLGPVPFSVANGDITSLVLMDNENGGLELMPVADAASTHRSN